MFLLHYYIWKKHTLHLAITTSASFFFFLYISCQYCVYYKYEIGTQKDG